MMNNIPFNVKLKVKLRLRLVLLNKHFCLYLYSQPLLKPGPDLIKLQLSIKQRLQPWKLLPDKLLLRH